jgi:hypothetical protein
MNMEAAGFSETLVIVYQDYTRIPEYKVVYVTMMSVPILG